MSTSPLPWAASQRNLFDLHFGTMLHTCVDDAEGKNMLAVVGLGIDDVKLICVAVNHYESLLVIAKAADRWVSQTDPGVRQQGFMGRQLVCSALRDYKRL